MTRNSPRNSQGNNCQRNEDKTFLRHSLTNISLTVPFSCFPPHEPMAGQSPSPACEATIHDIICAPKSSDVQQVLCNDLCIVAWTIGLLNSFQHHRLIKADPRISIKGDCRIKTSKFRPAFPSPISEGMRLEVSAPLLLSAFALTPQNGRSATLTSGNLVFTASGPAPLPAPAPISMNSNWLRRALPRFSGM